MKNPLFITLFSLPFFADSVLNLFWSRHKNLTKALLLPLLLLFALLCGKPSVFLLIALIFCFFGDVLLEVPGDKFFTLGGISFIFGHIFLMLVFAPREFPPQSKIYALIPFLLLYLGTSVFVIKLIAPDTPRKMRPPMLLYLCANSFMNVFAALNLITSPSVSSAVSYSGAVFFFISDCTLFIVRNYKGGKRFKSFFFCMLTYILGVFLITLGTAVL